MKNWNYHVKKQTQIYKFILKPGMSTWNFQKPLKSGHWKHLVPNWSSTSRACAMSPWAGLKPSPVVFVFLGCSQEFLDVFGDLLSFPDDIFGAGEDGAWGHGEFCHIWYWAITLPHHTPLPSLPAWPVDITEKPNAAGAYQLFLCF